MSLPSLHMRAALALLIIVGLGLSVSAPAAAATTTSLAYGTYIGGASDDVARAVVVDSLGNIYIAGTTYSAPFPGVAGERRDTNAFVTKLDPTGKRVLYSTLIGGSDDEEGLALAVDAQGNAWVTGYTQSDDLPLTKPLRSSLRDDNDTFVSKLGPTGAPLFQSYLGEFGGDQANGIALDGQGNAYIAGFTAWDFGPAVMVKKLKADGSAQVYQAYFGHAKRGFAKGSSARAIAVDAQGNAYIVGKTNTGALDTDGFQDQCVGYENEIDDCPSDDGFVMVLNAAGNAIVGGTILGGQGNDEATGVALDGQRNVYVAGTTFSADFPTKGAWQGEKAGLDNFADAFLVKLTPLAAGLVYGTYYGGEEYDEAHGLAVDGAGRAYLTGQTNSEGLAVPGAIQPAIEGLCLTSSTERYCYDAYVAAFDAAGALSWGSYLGGTDDDQGYGVDVGPGGDVYVAGRAESFSLPTTPGGLQPDKRSLADAYVVRVHAGASQPPATPQPPNTPQFGNRVYLPHVSR
jgi:hypothetical protein